MFIKITMFAIFAAVTLAVGFMGRKHASSVGSFVLGGRNVGAWLTAFSFGTSYFSAVIFVGYAGQFGWKFGISAAWIGLGNAVLGSLLPWIILGKRTRKMTQGLQSSTMPDFFGTRYNSQKIRFVAAIIIFIFLIPYTASLYNGLSRIFQMAFGIDYIWCIIGMAVLTGIYVVAGGYLATAVNDFIQGIIMLAGIIAVVVSVINGNGGFSSALAGLSEKGADFTAAFGPDPKALLGVVVLTSLGTWGLPQMVHKFYAIKDIKMISKGAIISTLFAVIVAGGCYLLGGFARLYDTADIYAAGTTNVIFDAIIPAMVSGLPDILIGIIMMLVFSASMSTLSALVLTSASTLTLDLIKPVFVKRMDDKRQLLNVRILIVIFTILSAALATVQYKSAVTFIAQLMGISWGALAGSFLAPFLYGLYLKRVTRAAVWASFICGVGLTVSNMFLKFIASPINAGAITMLASLVIVPIVSLLTPKLDDITVERAFKTLRD